MFLFLVTLGDSMYLPRKLPNEFKNGDEIIVLTNSMRSTKRPIPLDFYKLDTFCPPTDSKDFRTNIGEFLSGDTLKQTSITFKIDFDEKCHTLCEKIYNEGHQEYLKSLIDQKYRVSFMIDEIPVSELVYNPNTNYKDRIPGFELGYIENGKHYINNHIDFIVKLNASEDKSHQRIVGFEAAAAYSANSDCGRSVIALEESNKFVYSYSVQFEHTDIDWTKRWDTMLKINYDPKIHYFSIGNTFLIIICLTVVLFVIVLKAIKNDFARGKGIDDIDDPLEESGWKLIHGDVFRPPKHAQFLCSIVGGGNQIFIGGSIVLLIAALGFLAPLNTGSMLTTISIVYIIVSPISGFLSAKLFRTIGKDTWKSFILSSGLIFILPSIALYFIANFVFSYNDSTASITFKTLAELILLFFCINMILHVIGCILGLRSNEYDMPARVNQLPRPIPTQPIYLNPFVTSFIGGVISFMTILVQMYLIYQSLWTNLSYYYLFGLLFMVIILLFIVVTELTIFLVYLQLNNEDYRWWWASIRVSGSCGVACMIFSILFMVMRFHPPDASSYIIYIIFSTMISFGISLGTAAIGFNTSFLFVRKIYGALKME